MLCAIMRLARPHQELYFRVDDVGRHFLAVQLVEELVQIPLAGQVLTRAVVFGV